MKNICSFISVNDNRWFLLSLWNVPQSIIKWQKQQSFKNLPPVFLTNHKLFDCSLPLMCYRSTQWLHIPWNKWPPHSKTSKMKKKQDSLKTLSQLAFFLLWAYVLRHLHLLQCRNLETPMELFKALIFIAFWHNHLSTGIRILLL